MKPVYDPPVDQLLTLGPAEWRPNPWRSYVDLGVGPQHTGELLRMAADQALHKAPTESPHVWAPVHAWRALAELRIEGAVSPLLALLSADLDDDFAEEDLPDVFARIGPGALPELTNFILQSEHRLWARVAVIRAMALIASTDTAHRGQVVDAFAQLLSKWYRSDPTLNAFLISELLDLQAVEVAPLMKEAFDGGKVDLDVDGDWEDAQIRLGLLDERETPAPRPSFWPILEPQSLAGDQKVKKRGSAGSKAKRKAARQARKKNRRKR